LGASPGLGGGEQAVAAAAVSAARLVAALRAFVAAFAAAFAAALVPSVASMSLTGVEESSKRITEMTKKVAGATSGM